MLSSEGGGVADGDMPSRAPGDNTNSDMSFSGSDIADGDMPSRAPGDISNSDVSFSGGGIADRDMPSRVPGDVANSDMLFSGSGSADRDMHLGDHRPLVRAAARAARGVSRRGGRAAPSCLLLLSLSFNNCCVVLCHTRYAARAGVRDWQQSNAALFATILLLFLLSFDILLYFIRYAARAEVRDWQQSTTALFASFIIIIIIISLIFYFILSGTRRGPRCGTGSRAPLSGPAATATAPPSWAAAGRSRTSTGADWFAVRVLVIIIIVISSYHHIIISSYFHIIISSYHHIIVLSYDHIMTRDQSLAAAAVSLGH